jgi:hypothetical protein
MSRTWTSFFARARVAPLGRLLLGVMLLFHGWLLARRLESGDLLDAAVLWRWLGALGLLLFWAFQRRLASRLSPRARRSSNLAFWSLVLVLHSGLPAAPPGQAPAGIPLAEIGTLALPLLAALFLLDTAARLAAIARPAWRGAFASRDRGRRERRAGYLPQVSCRPPPVSFR